MRLLRMTLDFGRHAEERSVSKYQPAALLVALTLCVPGVSLAQDQSLDEIMGGFDDPVSAPTSEPAPGSLEDVMGGFDESAAPSAPEAPPPDDPSAWDVSGSVTASATYNVDQQAPNAGARDKRGLSRARTKVNVEVKGEVTDGWKVQADAYVSYDGVYRLRGRGNFKEPVVNDQQFEHPLGEAYLQGSATRSLDLKLGRQIVVWGKSDNIRVTDVLNPLDYREAGMTDIQDLRQALGMARADYYFGDWGLSGMVIPDIRFNRLPKNDSDYFIPAYAAGPERKPDSGLKNPEWGLALSGRFTGWDASFYLAEHFRDTATKYGGVYRHDKLRMAGGAVAVATGNWLLKGEAAIQDGIRYAALAENSYTRGDVLLGLDYSGFRETTVTVEVVDRHLFAYDAALDGAGAQRHDWTTALRVTGDYMHDRLHFVGLVSTAGLVANGGGYSRVSLGYDLADALTLTGGVMIYLDGERLPFSAWEANDRLFADVKWSF